MRAVRLIVDWTLATTDPTRVDLLTPLDNGALWTGGARSSVGTPRRRCGRARPTLAPDAAVGRARRRTRRSLRGLEETSGDGEIGDERLESRLAFGPVPDPQDGGRVDRDQDGRAGLRGDGRPRSRVTWTSDPRTPSAAVAPISTVTSGWTSASSSRSHGRHARTCRAFGRLVEAALATRRRPPAEVLDDIGHERRLPVDPRGLERAVEDAARRTHEWATGAVLLVARLLSDEDDPGRDRSLADDGLGGALPELALPARIHGRGRAIGERS